MFIDLQKAYDIVSKKVVLSAFMKIKVPKKVNVINNKVIRVNYNKM